MLLELCDATNHTPAELLELSDEVFWGLHGALNERARRRRSEG